MLDTDLIKTEVAMMDVPLRIHVETGDGSFYWRRLHEICFELIQEVERLNEMVPSSKKS